MTVAAADFLGPKRKEVGEVRGHGREVCDSTPGVYYELRNRVKFGLLAGLRRIPRLWFAIVSSSQNPSPIALSPAGLSLVGFTRYSLVPSQSR